MAYEDVVGRSLGYTAGPLSTRFWASIQKNESMFQLSTQSRVSMRSRFSEHLHPVPLVSRRTCSDVMGLRVEHAFDAEALAGE